MHTEIIGLIGGTFDKNARVLHVTHVYPCKSISSGIECEMDPISELEATNFFGLNIYN